jgi:hypothetical protein
MEPEYSNDRIGQCGCGRRRDHQGRQQNGVKKMY